MKARNSRGEASASEYEAGLSGTQTRHWVWLPSAAGKAVLPGLLAAAGSQRGSGSNVRENGLGAMLGAAESLTACRGIGLMGQYLSGALVFRSSTKSLQKHVEQFRQLYFNSAKLYEGTYEAQARPGCVRMRIKWSPSLRSLQFKPYLGTGQVWWGYSELHLKLTKISKHLCKTRW